MRATAGLAAILMAVMLGAAGCSQTRTPVAKTPPAPAPSATPGVERRIRVETLTPGIIPAGTKVEVRNNELITSSSSEGRTYSAEIATEIVRQDGSSLLPKGSSVELVLMKTRQGRGIRGSSVALGMRSVTIANVTYQVVSQEIDQTNGIGANRRTGQMIGGGAALGTLIGAVAGGGQGALIGGLAGAAAGALAQILTQNKEIRIPAETLLTFQLDEPVRLQLMDVAPASASATR